MRVASGGEKGSPREIVTDRRPGQTGRQHDTGEAFDEDNTRMYEMEMMYSDQEKRCQIMREDAFVLYMFLYFVFCVDFKPELCQASKVAKFSGPRAVWGNG